MDYPFKGTANPRFLSDDDFSKAAERLNCEVAAIRAIWDVEAAGRHFLADGSVVRRFEPHHFPKPMWDQIGFKPRPATVVAGKVVRAAEAPWRASLRLSDEAMFQRAFALAPDEAMRASSWGAPQIMGFNARDAGFVNARTMVYSMAKSAPQQLEAFLKLVEKWGIATSVRAHDWRAFAARYNGSGQVDHYARLIEAAYRKHSGKKSREVLRVGDRGKAVMNLQQALGIAADGAFGPATETAVRAFQKANGLAVDGVVGNKTWEALEVASGPVDAPTQSTPADARVDLTEVISAGVATVTAVAAAAGQLKPVLPEELYNYMAYGAVIALTLAAAAFLVKRVRR